MDLLHGKPNLTSDIKGKFLSQKHSFVFLLPRIIINIKHLNPFHPYISMHILHTVLYTFLQFWKGELLQQSRASLVSDQVLLMNKMCYSGVTLWGEIKY